MICLATGARPPTAQALTASEAPEARWRVGVARGARVRKEFSFPRRMWRRSVFEQRSTSGSWIVRR
jgi:hypothetical protein